MKLNDINLVGQIADLKETEYKNSLILASLIELLISKNIFTQKDLTQKTNELDFLAELQIHLKNNTKTSL
ncbi:MULTISPECIES: hypothetical protein [Anaerosinus]|uniref:Uncharacterized protein n=1 Tax=Selenobaculum gibii TaxID=3054208 RepID=A0A9Y2ET79_9FIRM|nr:hypothetical protein [Selenobaculum gbiensis]WIW71236.1 hypothetical protein P3F81_02575 [Selenobaculum gbiensis]